MGGALRRDGQLLYEWTPRLTAALRKVPLLTGVNSDQQQRGREEHALMGVQAAAYDPEIALSAPYGHVGDPLGSLIKTSNRVWSLGAAASETAFEGAPAARRWIRRAPITTSASRPTGRRCGHVMRDDAP